MVVESAGTVTRNAEEKSKSSKVEIEMVVSEVSEAAACTSEQVENPRLVKRTETKEVAQLASEVPAS